MSTTEAHTASPDPGVGEVDMNLEIQRSRDLRTFVAGREC